MPSSSGHRRSRSHKEPRSSDKHRRGRSEHSARHHRHKEKIDKHKLREIATKNATKLVLVCKLPRGAELISTIKDRSVKELVDVCKSLQEDGKAFSKASSKDEDSYARCCKAISKGLSVQYKETVNSNDVSQCVTQPICQSSIKLNIPNATCLPIKTSRERWTEACVDKPDPPLISAFIPVKKSESVEKQSHRAPANKLSRSYIDESTAKDSAMGSFKSKRSEFATHPVHDVNDKQSTYYAQICALQQKWEQGRAKVADFPVSSGYQHREIIDRECVYTERLPKRWQQSIPNPRILSAYELRPDFPWLEAWATNKNLKDRPCLDGQNKGLKLLQNMGWKSGQGLGKENQGPVDPLDLKLKLDRKGLSSAADKKLGKKESVLMKDGRNPVSVLLEYCQRRHIDLPSFTCMEVELPNGKGFLWRAIFNGLEYEPSLPSSNKKAGKAQVCLVILKAISVGAEQQA
uniref:G-patch domain-containing protein n=1 Tax=Ditylenchus dipsaci TaxID=166011 RepID=A0A915D4C3_9BILA